MQRGTAMRHLLAAMLSVCALAAAPAVARADSVLLSIDVTPESGSEADTFVITVHVEVPDEQGPERYTPPAFPDFAIVDQRSNKTLLRQLDPLGGVMLKTLLVYRYVVRPVRAGALRIDGARVIHGGQAYESEPVLVDVQPRGNGLDSSAPPPGAHRDPTAAGGIGAPGFEPPRPARIGGRTPDMFLHVAVEPMSAYVGEQITVTWLLYTRHEVLKFEPSIPRLDDFWSEILHEPSAYFRYHEDVVQSMTYRVVAVSKRALFPLRPGTLVIEPYTARVSSLYTPLGTTSELASPAVEIQVMPLPEGAPPGFDPSYVGTFQVEAEVDRRRVAANEPVTLTVTVRGQGAIRRTTPPALDLPGFEFRAPRDFDEVLNASNKVVSGARTYRYWATPRRGGTQTIPAVIVPFFDPHSATYQQASSRPIDVEVVGEPDAAVSPAEHADLAIPTHALRPIRDGSSISSRDGARPHRAPWFWAAALLPWAAFLAVAWARGSGPARARQRRAERSRFRVAEMHRVAGRTAAFFAELSRILIACVEQRTATRARSLTSGELASLLREHGVAPTTIERLQRELEQCDFARFAATAARPDDMQAALRRVQALTRELLPVRAAAADGRAADGRGADARGADSRGADSRGAAGNARDPSAEARP